MSILFGRSDGTFRQPVYFPARFEKQTSTGELGPRATIDVGDLNHDGFPDLLIDCCFETAVRILLNDGDGDFSRSTSVLPTDGVSHDRAKLGDVNGDGHLDVVATDRFRQTVTLHLGRGNGTFERETRTELAERFEPDNLTIADMNQDGIDDVVLGTVRTPNLLVLLGTGQRVASTSSGSSASVCRSLLRH